MKKITEREPVAVIIGAFIALINAVLLALPLFGVSLTAEQTAALMGIFTALGALGVVLARQRVTPMAAPRTARGLPGTIVEFDAVEHV